MIHFDISKIQLEINELEQKVNAPNFWDNPTMSTPIVTKLKRLKNEVETFRKLEQELNNIDEMSLLLIDEPDEQMSLEVLEATKKVEKELNELEIKTLLSGKYDQNNAILTLHPGAGGTESQDWVQMLYRMYSKWASSNNYTVKELDYLEGDEAGIKSVTFLISGEYAYGYLKGEMGVHRLVRISPFDSNKRRHTSFASVSVVPEFDKSVDIEIKESDLKIDVYHSSGAGGQSVNTSDSAVRITHLPTKIVVTCQVERSQLRNKERAMEMLKSKLYKLELDKKQEELDKVKGVVSSINFGSQIRSYVLEPYTLVKDYRSNYETSAALKVLDGDIMPVIESVLRIKK